MPGLARIASALALVLASLLVTFSVAELVARWLYQEPWTHALVGATAQSEVRFPDQHGPHGLRDDAYAEPAAPGVARILLLGDSFTYGSGVARRDATFPELLEASLPGVVPFGAVEVLNGGVPGSLTGEWVALYDRVATSFDPDLVLAVFFLRDGTLTHTMGGFFDPIRKKITLRNAGSALYQTSYLFRTFRDRADNRTIGESYGRAIQHSYLGSVEETAEWQRAQANLVALRDRARAAGSAFGLVIFPILVALDDSYPFRDVIHAIETFGTREEIATLSILPAFIGHDASSLWVSQIDQHPNEAGHAIAAAAISAFASRFLNDDNTNGSGMAPQ